MNGQNVRFYNVNTYFYYMNDILILQLMPTKWYRTGFKSPQVEPFNPISGVVEAEAVSEAETRGKERAVVAAVVLVALVTSITMTVAVSTMEELLQEVTMMMIGIEYSAVAETEIKTLCWMLCTSLHRTNFKFARM